VNEEYVLFPTELSDEVHRKLSDSFTYFKQDIEEYFTSFISVVGTGYYQDEQARKLKIDIPIQFYGAAELVGFTQYLTEKVLEHFQGLEVEVSVTSTNGPEALIIKEADNSEPFVHIYQY
jgi:protein involved in sex pheromone biosynthesis